jgi:toxin HigB-1
MIVSFGSKDTERIWTGDGVSYFLIELQHIVRRKLRMLNQSHSLSDLRIPPSNRLEKLRGNLTGYYSIRVNDRWRIVFKWDNGNASEVEIVDYH